MSKFRFRKMGLLVAASIIGATALVLPASPAGAVNPAKAVGVFGLGVATGIVKGTDPASLACDVSSGPYVFNGVVISGVAVDTSTVLPGLGAGLTSLAANNQPSGQATGDPLDGTPLGCGGLDLGLSNTVTGTVDSLEPTLGANDVPLVSCPGVNNAAACTTGTGSSNIVADEGTVAGALNGAGTDFTCAGGTGVTVACSLSGTFVRYGTTVLVFMEGCVKTGGGTCNYTAGSPTEDVALVMQVQTLPVEPSFCPLTTIVPPSPLFKCSAIAGPYVITPHGAVFEDPTGPGGPQTQAGLDIVYCPLGTHTNGTYPAVPNCNNS